VVGEKKGLRGSSQAEMDLFIGEIRVEKASCCCIPKKGNNSLPKWGQRGSGEIKSGKSPFSETWGKRRKTCEGWPHKHLTDSKVRKMRKNIHEKKRTVGEFHNTFYGVGRECKRVSNERHIT